MALHLVTGGAGFVGSILARRLLEQGEDVRVFDMVHSDRVPEGVQMYAGDMRDRRAVRHACRGVDVVYHLAFIQASSKNVRAKRWNINFKGTKHFIEYSQDAGVKRFVLVSSMDVYSPRPPCPCTELASTEHPYGWYGRHKAAVERLAMEYHEMSGFPVVTLRFPTICGPGYYARKSLLDLMDWIARGRPLIWIDGPDIRCDFVHIDDVIQGLLLAGRAPDKAGGQVFNVSCSEPATPVDLMKACLHHLGRRMPIIRVPREPGIALARLMTRTNILDFPPEQLDYLFYDNFYSSDKARKTLGYEPQFTAEEAVIELFRSYLPQRTSIRAKAKNY